MVSLGGGISGSHTSSSGYTRYIGDGGTYDPQLALADYLGRLGLQHKTQSDDLYGGSEHAKNMGYGLFDMKMFGDPNATLPTAAPPIEEQVTPAAPPPAHNSQGAPTNPGTTDTTVPGGNTGGGGGNTGGGNGGGGGTGGGGGNTGGGGGTGKPPKGGSVEPIDVVQQAGPTPEELLRQWTASRR